MVTTVAFGIPSSVSTAILLGAFLIQGIVPGPDLLDPAKHLALTSSFVWIIIVSNIITVSICFLFLNQLAKITFVRGSLLIPFLLLLICVGAFTVKNSYGDLIVMLIFGALGWLMVQFDWPRPPLLLGFVLGGIAERKLWISIQGYGTEWVTQPGVLIIGVIILGTIGYSILQSYRERHKPQETSGPMAEPRATILQSPVYRSLFALFWIGFFIYIVRETLVVIRPKDVRPAIFPLVIGVPSLALAVLAFCQEFLKTFRGVGQSKPSAATLSLDSALVQRRTVSVISWIIGFFLAIWLLGFNIAVPVATFLYLKVGARERWPLTTSLTLLAWLFFYGLFDYSLHLPFPKGELFLWFKLLPFS